MAILARILGGIGWNAGSRLNAALKSIDDNFQALDLTVKDSAAAAYTAIITDRTVTRSNAGAQTFTVPTNAAVAFPIGTELFVIQAGAGALTINGAGVTLNKLATKSLVALGQWAVIKLKKTGTNVWVVSGDLGAA